ncbi:MAG TPA: hypothetical protein PKV48_07110 [Thermodesulfobacteriota bacterium]|nr:hypothetical protein [Thermodesulfobacteriota bacterium]
MEDVLCVYKEVNLQNETVEFGDIPLVITASMGTTVTRFFPLRVRVIFTVGGTV